MRRHVEGGVGQGEQEILKPPMRRHVLLKFFGDKLLILKPPMRRHVNVLSRVTIQDFLKPPMRRHVEGTLEPVFPSIFEAAYAAARHRAAPRPRGPDFEAAYAAARARQSMELIRLTF